MTRRRTLPGVIGLVTIGALSVGCETILGVDFGSAKLRGRTPGADASNPDGSGACDPIHALERPASLAPATDTVEFSVVIRDVDFGDTVPDAGLGGYYDVGFDQDGVCTGRSGGESGCAAIPWIGTTRTDGPRGEDNSVGELMIGQTQLFGIAAVSSTLANDNLRLGLDTPMGVVRVSAYGGLGNDDRVEVDWFVAGTLGRGGDGGVAPMFDETDAWPVSADTVVDTTAATAGATDSKFRDANAFVERGVLVAHFPVVRTPLRSVLFAITDVTLTAKVDRDLVTNEWTLSEGVVSARTSVDGLLHTIPQIAYDVYGVTLCTDDLANYPAVKRFICSSADLPAAGNANPAAPCAASSFGMRFGTAPASLGALFPPAAVQSFCSTATDPKNDTCTSEQSP